MTELRAAKVEIYEQRKGQPNGIGVIRPNRIRINGTDVLTLEGDHVRFSEMPTKHAPLTMTITILVESVTVRAEHDAPGWELKAVEATRRYSEAKMALEQAQRDLTALMDGISAEATT